MKDGRGGAERTSARSIPRVRSVLLEEMRRLFEFSDQPWLPKTFRDLLTELLEFQHRKYDFYRAAIPKLNDALRRSGSEDILDLCSGSGGPLLQLLPDLEARRLTLSDRHPNRRVVEALSGTPGVSYVPYPVDARAVPPGLAGCRTLFTGLHHFDPPNARRVLEDAVAARAPIAVFEFTDRAFARLRTLFVGALLAVLDSWEIRPRRWKRLFWTYVVPVMPIVYAWDGIVSHSRTYAPDELGAMTDGLTSYAWETGRLPSALGPLRVTYLVGNPAG